jgi:hypothetical protein
MALSLQDLKRQYYLANAPGALMSDSLADLEYKFFSAAIAGVNRGSVFSWTASLTPGPGQINVENTGGQNRTIYINKVDFFGFPKNYAVILPGDNITVTNDPDTPPVTGFARYLVLTEPVDLGDYVTIACERKDISGSPSAPPEGTRVRAILSFSA